MSPRSQYSKAPLALALIEIKHPSASLTAAETKALQRLLRPVAPVYQEAVVNSQDVQIGPGGVQGVPVRTATWQCFDSRDGRTRIAFGPEAMTVETTKYMGWDDLVERFGEAVRARMEVSDLVGVLRIGLRYIDEFRVADVELTGWSTWVERAFLPPEPSGLGLSPSQQSCVVQYETDEPGELVTARYGAVVAPAAVNGPLRPDTPQPGPYFLLDTDVSWQHPAGTALPEIDLGVVDRCLERLHLYAKGLFESVVTDAYREVIR